MPPAGAQGAAVKPDPKATEPNMTDSDKTTNTPPPEGDNLTAGDKVPGSDAPGLFVIVYETREGRRHIELHDELAAESRYAELTYANRTQRRRHADEDDEFTLGEGGGAFEIEETHVIVYRLGATVHKFG